MDVPRLKGRRVHFRNSVVKGLTFTTFWANSTDTVAQLVEHPLCDWEVLGSISVIVIPKTSKMVLAALSLGT